ncbi:MAG: MotA/TolQ/ExbB proton channel family protein [Kofleriaceae bacterium]|nr:MotA/TolQ/ExbB proton channel family protein [Kofleriaceae bacterium]
MTQEDTIDAQLLDLMLRAGSRWVLWVLIALSLAAIAVMIERIWFFVQERPPKEQLARALHALRESGAKAALDKLAGARSMQAKVARACLEHAADGAASVEEHKAAVLEQERLRYERSIAFLGTLGNNAPFVGLFGTVLGIIRAFNDLSAGGGQGTEAVMAGIAEALVATGVGLLVALPAVAAYNAFLRLVETTSASADALAHQILAHLKSTRAGVV